MRLALTGASGFLGRPLLRHLIDAGHHVRVLTHRNPPAASGVEIVHGNLLDEAALARLVAGADGVLHVAGCIAAADETTFDRINRLGTEKLVEAAGRAEVGRFLFVSSLAAREPRLSAYGRSKQDGEAAVSGSGLDWDILRPPATYGPGDEALLHLLRPLKAGIALLPGGRAARSAVIHVEDAAAAIVAWLGVAPTRRVYEIDDGTGGRPMIELLRIASQALCGKDPSFVATPPLPLLRLIARFSEAAARRSGAPPFLSAGKLAELRHADWSVDALPWQAATGWLPSIDFPTGIADTIARLREAGRL